MELDPIKMNLQPVVVLQRLTDEEINFYTKCSQKRRSYRKKKEGRKNLKDEQNVDFSFFDEYRRSRNTYMKKKERKKKKYVRKKKKQKTVELPLEIAPSQNLIPSLPAEIALGQNPSSWLPHEIPTSVLSNNDGNKVPVKVKRQRKKKDPTEKKKKKKPRMKFHARMVIKSDSDCSVENYGIVYSGAGNAPVVQQHGYNGETVGPNLQQNVFMSSPLPFHSNIQNSISSSPNISPSCSDVMINEQDILSALDCEPEEDFYKAVIGTKMGNLDQSSPDNSFLAFMNNADAKVINEQYDFQTHQKLAEIIPSAMTASLSVHDKTCSSDDIVKESCDVVSKIMQDMDREYANRKKNLISNKQNSDTQGLQVKPHSFTSGYSPVIINLQPAKTVLPSGVTISAVGNTIQQTKSKQIEDEDKSGDASNIVDDVSMQLNDSSTPDELTKIINVHPDVTLAVDSLVKAISLSCQQPFTVDKRNEQKCTKLVTFCCKCHLVFTPNAQRKDICEKCFLLNYFDSTLRKEPPKKKANKQGKTTGTIRFASPKKNPFLKRLSPLKLKKTAGFRSSFVKKLSVHDKSRLLSTNTSKKHHLKTKIDLDAGSLAPEVPETTTSQIEKKDLPKSSSSMSVTLVPKATADSEKKKDLNRLEKYFSIKKMKLDDIGKTSLDCSLESSIANKKIEPSGDNAEKGGFTMKSIDKGLTLMSFTEPDKELDFSLDSASDLVVNKSEVLSAAKTPNSSHVKQDKNISMTMIKENLQGGPNLSGVKDLAYQFVVPNSPMMVVAHYAKDQQGSDFHLSRVSYQKKGQQNTSLSVVPLTTTSPSTGTTAITQQSNNKVMQITTGSVTGSGLCNLRKNEGSSMPIFPVSHLTSNQSIAPKATTSNINITKLNLSSGGQCRLNSELSVVKNGGLFNSIQIQPINSSSVVPHSNPIAPASIGFNNISVTPITPVSNSSASGTNVCATRKEANSTLTTKSVVTFPIAANSSISNTNNSEQIQSTLNKNAQEGMNTNVSNPGAAKVTDTTLVPYTAPSSKSPPTENSNTRDDSQNFSDTGSEFNQHQDTSTTTASLVLHELDAIAILSILDLDGNAHHSNNLLHNLFIKELHELQKLKALYHEATEDDIKEIANMKCIAKMSRIKSLSIARALLKKYGELSKVIEAVLTKPMTENSLPYDSVSASVKEPNLSQDLALLRQPKLEKNLFSSNCCMYQRKSTEEMDTQADTESNTSIIPYQHPEPVMNTNNAAITNVSASESISIKPEKRKSSCMLSELLRNDVNAATVPSALSQLSITPVSNTSNPATTTALVPVNPVGYFNSSPSFSQLNNPVSMPSAASYNSSLQTDNFSNVLSSQPNNAGVSLTPIISRVVEGNVKGETTQSSCQLQNQKTSVNPYNNFMQTPQIQSSLLSLPAPPQNPSMTSLLSPTAPTQNASMASLPVQQTQIMPYQPILPAVHVSQASNGACPNVTVPFATARLAGSQMNMSRSLVPMNFVRNTTNSLVPNPLTVQQVVLSNVSPVSVPQNRFAVTPYNYIMPRQSSTALQMVPQQMSNVYAVYQQSPGNTHTQVVCRPTNAVYQQSSINSQVVCQPTNAVYQQSSINSQVVRQPTNAVYQQSPINSQLVRQPTNAVYQQSSGNTQIVCQTANVPKPVSMMANKHNGSQALQRLDQMHCVVCGKRPTMRCKQCAQVVYCDTECAKIYWHQRHKMECKPTSEIR